MLIFNNNNRKFSSFIYVNGEWELPSDLLDIPILDFNVDCMSWTNFQLIYFYSLIDIRGVIILIPCKYIQILLLIFLIDSFDCKGIYRCQNSRICVPMSGMCNGVAECPGKDDELFCDVDCPQECTCSDTSFDCSGKDLSSLSWEQPVVRQLDLSRNSLIEVPTGIKSMSFLTNLFLHTNKIQNLTLGTFSSVQNLLRLDLSYNQIDILVMGIFDGLSSLIDLRLNGNPLLSISVQAFRGLQSLPRLDLSGLSLREISGGVFEGLDKLEHLDLSGNEITDMKSGSLSGVYDVRVLNLSDNNVINYAEEEFALLKNLEFLHSDDYMFCCFAGLEGENCLPKADQFSSCEDLMSNDILRSFLWIIGFTSLFGNLFVLIWRRLSGEQLTVASTLVSNLAASDFLMGVYMISIASVDAFYRGNYIKHATAWRHSIGCQVLGVMSTIASEVSVLVLLVLTADRFKNIVFPFKGRRLTVSAVRIILGGIWTFFFCLAIIPLFPIEYFSGGFYSTSGVCISIYLTSEETPGWQYSVAIFHGMNLVVFMLIFVAYSYIYYTIKKVAAKAGKEKKTDMATARKMALIIFTDFFCWVPINIMGKSMATLCIISLL